MDRWLKWLIAAACCVVVAFGLRSGWVAASGWYQEHQYQQQMAQIESDCDLTVLKLAKFVKTDSAYEDVAKAMTKQVRYCLSVLPNTGFPLYAENTMRKAGYSLSDTVALPSAD